VVISAAASFGPLGLLDGATSAQYLSDGYDRSAASPPAEPLSLLDPDRSRRFGRASALVVATAERALSSGGLAPTQVGLITGSAFGDVDRSVRFLQRLFAQGAKFASPAEFPQLVASTGSGNASLYLGLTGPCLSVSEQGTSGESALSVAISCLELGLAAGILAGAAESHDAVVDVVLAGDRSEGGGFVLLEPASVAVARGHVALAHIAQHRATRGDAERAFAELAAPRVKALACVVVGRLPAAAAGALTRSSWRAAPRYDLAKRVGYHEALGALALAVAAAEVASGRAEQALVVTADLDTVYVTQLARVGASA
jgi:3-oxoacyl-[acyl-carrier-protein] synthase II